MDLEIKDEWKPDVLARLNEPVQKIHTDSYPKYFKEYSYDDSLQFFNEISTKPEWKCFITYSGSEPVGYVICFVRDYQENPFRKAYKGIYIDQICVSEGHRRKGIGEKLMSQVESFAKRERASQLELTFWEKNIHAKNFYEKNGFENDLHFVLKSL